MDKECITYLCLLKKLIDDLLGGANLLRPRIKRDNGQGVKWSASSLAQEGYRVLNHLSSLKHSKICFNNASVSKDANELCEIYLAIESKFENVINDLASIAAPESVERVRKGKVEKVKDWLELRLIPQAGTEKAETINTTVVALAELAPNLLKNMDVVIEEAKELEKKYRQKFGVGF